MAQADVIPTPRDDDPEEAADALAIAAAMWGRGEKDDALTWLRRAAERAKEAGSQGRAHELAGAAAALGNAIKFEAANDDIERSHEVFVLVTPLPSSAISVSSVRGAALAATPPRAPSSPGMPAVTAPKAPATASSTGGRGPERKPGQPPTPRPTAVRPPVTPPRVPTPAARAPTTAATGPAGVTAPRRTISESTMRAQPQPPAIPAAEPPRRPSELPPPLPEGATAPANGLRTGAKRVEDPFASDSRSRLSRRETSLGPEETKHEPEVLAQSLRTGAKRVEDPFASDSRSRLSRREMSLGPEETKHEPEVLAQSLSVPPANASSSADASQGRRAVLNAPRVLATPVPFPAIDPRPSQTITPLHAPVTIRSDGSPESESHISISLEAPVDAPPPADPDQRHMLPVDDEETSQVSIDGLARDTAARDLADATAPHRDLGPLLAAASLAGKVDRPDAQLLDDEDPGNTTVRRELAAANRRVAAEAIARAAAAAPTADDDRTLFPSRARRSMPQNAASPGQVVGVRVRVYTSEAGAWVVPEQPGDQDGVAAILIPVSPLDDLSTLFPRGK